MKRPPTSETAPIRGPGPRSLGKVARDLLDGAPDAMIVADEDGSIVFVNAEAERMFGYRRDDLIGDRIERLLPERLRQRHVEHRAQYAAAPRLRPMGAGFDLLARHSDGSEFPVEIGLSPLRTDARKWVTASVRDISERRRLEREKDELAIKRVALYEAEQRARSAAEESLRRLAESERLKDDLTSMVVHDLKNPVNGILMLVQLSLRKGTDLSPQHVERLRQIEMTCGEMTRLIQNLLEISKMEEGQMPIAREPVALREIVADVLREYTSMAGQMSRRLQLGDGGELLQALGDPALIRRIVINLVVNALRHSGSEHVWVEVTPDGAGESALLRVIDHGRGIPLADQARVFEKFAVVRRAVGDPSGDTGLGLPFCKLATERMGGRIALTSSAEETVFAVTLPLAR